MKKYYLYKSLKKYGPFNLQELQREEINKNDLIWYKGLEDWVKAIEIDELKDYFDQLPPLTPFEKKQEKLKKIPRKGLGFLFKGLFTLILSTAIILIFIVSQDFGITGFLNIYSFVKWLLIIGLTFLIFKIWSKKAEKVDVPGKVEPEKMNENELMDENEIIDDYNKPVLSDFEQLVILITPLIIIFFLLYILWFYRG